MKLKDIRVSRGLSQSRLAQKLGVSRSAVSMWEIGASQPDNDMLRQLADIFEISVDELLDHRVPKGVKIPVLGVVQAGVPIEAVEDVLDYEEITPEMARSGTYFALQIRGDSMEPRMCEGDVVIVRQQPTADSGQVAVVLVNGDHATVKRIKKQTNGIMLVANNLAYEPVFYTNRDIKQLPVVILGVVEELRGKSAF